MMPEPILRIEDLKKRYPVRSGLFGAVSGHVRALDGVSLEVGAGETLSIVGESGCGKSTLCRNLLLLERPDSGHVFFQGRDLLNLDRRALQAVRRDIQVVFQDPYSSLPPHMTIGEAVMEGMVIHRIGASTRERRERSETLLSKVGLLPLHSKAGPSELSGGQRQRAFIARALAVEPKLLVCDEPVSALDVSIRAQVLNLLLDLQAEFRLTYIFVSHDLAVVRLISDRIAVMYLGKIVELCSRDDLYAAPLHPYTLSLLLSVPSARVSKALLDWRKKLLVGEPASAAHVPPGCRYHPRCAFADDQCRQVQPELVERRPADWVACHHWERVAPAGLTIARSLAGSVSAKEERMH